MDGCAVVRGTFGCYISLLSGALVSDVDIRDHSYVSYRSQVVNASIGKFCSIGAGVDIGLGRHPSRDFVSTYPGFYAASNTGCARPFRKETVFDEAPRRTVIEHDVWIGNDAIVPGGVVIGTGAIVAAGSVVVKDVAPYAIVGGNPASFIRPRFDDVTIRRLLASKWWDWPLDELERNVHRFADVRDFLSFLDSQVAARVE
jgi:acetyltransferase-like isoleucine patch superfamily enzyme